MALIFIVGSGFAATTAGSLLSDMGHRVTFVDFHESGVNALRAKGYDACLANDIDCQPGAFIFLASEYKSEGEPPRGARCRKGLGADSWPPSRRLARDVPCSAESER